MNEIGFDRGVSYISNFLFARVKFNPLISLRQWLLLFTHIQDILNKFEFFPIKCRIHRANENLKEYQASSFAQILQVAKSKSRQGPSPNSCAYWMLKSSFHKNNSEMLHCISTSNSKSQPAFLSLFLRAISLTPLCPSAERFCVLTFVISHLVHQPEKYSFLYQAQTK